jgi:hypothetical protein
VSAVTRERIRTTLARSLWVVAAFAAALVAYILTREMPERSPWDWMLLASVLVLLALAAGLLMTSIDVQED